MLACWMNEHCLTYFVETNQVEMLAVKIQRIIEQDPGFYRIFKLGECVGVDVGEM